MNATVAKGRKAADSTEAIAVQSRFIERLAGLRILDPACGSGNFLYVALQRVKALEFRVVNEGEALGLPPRAPQVGPEILLGIEINPLAAELARATVWIGDIQESMRHSLYTRPEPVLRKLEGIACRDALLNVDGTEAVWPAADVIVGNPPFLGGKLLRRGLSDGTVEALFATYNERVPRQADLVCYWFAKAWAQVQTGQARAVGLVSTNSLRGGANRKVIDPIAAAGAIFEAWSDEPWVVDGAAVRVSLVCFGRGVPPQGLTPHPEEARRAVSKDEGSDTPFETQPPAASQGEVTGVSVQLNGVPVARVNADLTASISDLTSAVRLAENAERSFIGIQKTGPFDISGNVARSWLKEPTNPNGVSNATVLRTYLNGADVTRRPRDKWLLDFGNHSEEGAALFEAPFEFAFREIKPFRAASAIAHAPWWKLWRPRPELALATTTSKRYLATPEVAKHRVFVWLDGRVAADKNLTAIARDDDTTFGILHSRFHETWALRLGTWLGVGNDPRYTPTTTFETFPFPEGLTPNIPAADYANDPRAQKIAAAARELDARRNAWLNPPDLVDIVPEVVPGYPDRILPKNAEAAAVLKDRTLTKLYNARPQWLANLHDALDRAVAAAYGWPQDIATEDALANLLALNLARAAKQEEK